jgi:endonuclease-3
MKAVSNENIRDVFGILGAAYPTWNAPVISFMAQVERNPFKLLIATLISLRTKDEVTAPASQRLFARADSPAAMLRLDAKEIEKLIYPAGFYKTKAKNILEVCRQLIERFGCQVPDDLDVLLTLPGVGRKTANLVVAEGFQKPGICVDTHVHRISNRWGYVKTEMPEDTEMALRKKLPADLWPHINKYLVAFGQTLCKPISPHCSECLLAAHCPRKNVAVSR